MRGYNPFAVGIVLYVIFFTTPKMRHTDVKRCITSDSLRKEKEEKCCVVARWFIWVIQFPGNNLCGIHRMAVPVYSVHIHRRNGQLNTELD